MNETTAPAVPRRRHTARWVALGVGFLVVVLGVVLATQVNSSPTFEGGALLGEPAPEFALTSFEGEPVDNASLEGKAVIVNFWNSWCIPCRAEHDALAEFYARHAGEPDFAMVGIVRDDTEDAAREWVEERGVDWTVAMDPRDQAALGFATTGQPETYAISPDGVVVGKQLSEVTVDDLELMLERARAGA